MEVFFLDILKLYFHSDSPTFLLQDPNPQKSAYPWIRIQVAKYQPKTKRKRNFFFAPIAQIATVEIINQDVS